MKYVLYLGFFIALVSSPFAHDYEVIISENGAAREYFWEGAKFKEKGALADANNSLKRALEKADDCFIGVYLLWEICDSRGDTEGSAFYSSRLNGYPVYDDEYREVCNTYYESDYAGAIRRGEEYIEEYHDTVDAIAVCHFIGRALYFQGQDMGRAWDVLNEAFTYSGLMPGTVPAYDVGEDVVIDFANGARP
jgi:hypothetical protein